MIEGLSLGVAVLGALPWLGAGAFLRFGIRPLRPLPDLRRADSLLSADNAPEVTVVVPARNEARGIERCVRSLAMQEYPAFRIVVVDDGSTDGTGGLARGIDPGNARTLTVQDGEPLPEGWFGKPWACAQGAAETRSGLLLFTDADTWHHPSLLRRAVAGLEEDGAHALSLLGHQELGSRAERLVQPQVLTLLGLRYRDLRKPLDVSRQGDAIANGQFILVTHDAYRAMGGHAAVRGEVVEDLALAQEITARGYRLTLREAEDAFSTRMYHSLREIVEGWTKNMAVGGRRSAASWGRAAARLVVPGILLFLSFWIAPMLVLAGAGAWFGTSRVLPLVPPAWLGHAALWAGLAATIGVMTWGQVYRRFQVSPLYGLAYPLGMIVVMFVAARSGLRGAARIEWKGRRYGTRPSANAD